MRLVIAILAVCVFAANAAHQLTFPELKQMWQRFLLKHMDECVEETGVERILAERLLPYGEYVDNSELKCFIKCVAMKMHMVEEDVQIDPNDFLDILNIHEPKVRNEIITECFDKISQEDECDQIFKISECGYFIAQKALSGKEKIQKILKDKSEL